MRVLTINTYGGSLLLGARALGAEIVASLEDKAFGLPIQQANFPELEYRPYLKDWEPRDLSETVVIAHPPCSAFSVQNSSWTARGTGSDAFACTVKVLEYATKNKALAICVESVMGALNGAWHVHQKYADERGYDLYRILQNGCEFGAQWRDRFWAVWVRKGAARTNEMLWSLSPRWRSVRDTLDAHLGWDESPSCGNTDELLARLKEKLVTKSGCTWADMAHFFDPPTNGDKHHETQGFQKVFHQRMFPKEDLWEITKEHVGTFTSGLMCYVNPGGLAPCILGGSWFYMNGRNMTENEYKVLMGFPAGYVFPGGYRRNMRTFLSKGVMPPVANWVLCNVFAHLGAESRGFQHVHDSGPTRCARCQAGLNVLTYRILARPNDLADFRIHKRQWGQDRPSLRHEDP